MLRLIRKLFVGGGRMVEGAVWFVRGRFVRERK